MKNLETKIIFPIKHSSLFVAQDIAQLAFNYLSDEHSTKTVDISLEDDTVTVSADFSSCENRNKLETLCEVFGDLGMIDQVKEDQETED